jgi:hypothetical protein
MPTPPAQHLLLVTNKLHLRCHTTQAMAAKAGRRAAGRHVTLMEAAPAAASSQPEVRMLAAAALCSGMPG